MEVNITPYKGRSLDTSKPVDVYRCLNRSGYTYSIKQGSYVVGHCNYIVLEDCQFIVNESGQQRARREQVRNVHAVIRGYVCETRLPNNLEFKTFKYNPYKTDKFMVCETNEYINTAWLVMINEDELKLREYE